MKKIGALFLAVCTMATLFLFAAACGSQAPDLSVETSQPETTTEEQATEDESTEEETTLEAEESKVFSYSEIDSKFGPGPFSVNELAAVFGEPTKLFGTIYSMSSGHFALIAEFEGISFDLVSRDEGLSFDTEDNFNTLWPEAPEFPVMSQDKALKIKPHIVTITSDKIAFARGIKIGDSKEKVIAAYDGCAGDEREHEGITQLFYTYRLDETIEYTDDEIFNKASQTGTINYWFEVDKLIEIHVSWYNGYLAFD